jgi:hypothetical protein
MGINKNPGKEAFIIILLIFLSTTSLISGAEDYNRIPRVQVIILGPNPSVSQIMMLIQPEPLIQTSVIITPLTDELTIEEKRRIIRFSFPRTYEKLGSYDFVYLSQTDTQVFTDQQIEWLYKWISEGGGSLQTTSVLSKNQLRANQWAQSTLSEAFPNNADQVISARYHRGKSDLEIRINNATIIPDIVKSYEPYLETSLLWETHLMVPREGAEIYSWAITSKFKDYSTPIPSWTPHIMAWQYGQGYTWSLMDTPPMGFWSPIHNKYTADIQINMIMYSHDRELPQNIILTHEIRQRISDYLEARRFFYQLNALIDQFGGNPDPIDNLILTLNHNYRIALTSYTNKDLSTTMETLKELSEKVEQARQDADKYKAEAFFWIYLIEYLVVGGTIAITGTITWEIMVRKRYYKQVKYTRPR